MATEHNLAEAARLLAHAAHAPARVFLFGSHARGTAGIDSDLDFLVVERLEGNRFGEMVRLRQRWTR